MTSIGNKKMSTHVSPPANIITFRLTLTDMTFDHTEWIGQYFRPRQMKYYQTVSQDCIINLYISGNAENLEEIQQNLDFSYVRILKMMYSTDDMVRLLAGAALAVFAFNSLQNQKDIAEQGGVRFSCFIPFLQSEDEFFRCNAAFQVNTPLEGANS